MRRRYGSLVTQALFEQRSDIARDAYEQTEILPQTETETQLLMVGYSVNGNFSAGNDAFIILHKKFDSYLLKAMTVRESTRARALLQTIAGEGKSAAELITYYLTNFELQQIGNKHFMIMPQYVNTIEILPQLTEESGIQLYSQMADALNYLHNLPGHYNHMDVKPSNICTREDGRIVLIDLGSVVTLGNKSESTQVYVPQDFQQRPHDNPTSNVYVAQKSNDWWMLAMTIAEKVYELPVGQGAKRPPLMSELRTILNNEVWADLLAKLVED